MPHEIGHLSASQLADKIKQAPAPLLLDVREPWEFDLAKIPGSTSLPMGQIPTKIADLDPARETVLICHSGRRSQRVAEFLAQAGFTNLFNLDGGIDAWSTSVDPSVPRY